MKNGRAFSSASTRSSSTDFLRTVPETAYQVTALTVRRCPARSSGAAVVRPHACQAISSFTSVHGFG